FAPTAPTAIYTLSLHDALPICRRHGGRGLLSHMVLAAAAGRDPVLYGGADAYGAWSLRALPAPPVSLADHRAVAARARIEHRGRSEEHTSELQSRRDLVCRLLL